MRYALALILACCFSTATYAWDDDVIFERDGKVEVAVLGGVILASPQFGDDAFVIGFPYGAAGINGFAFPSFRASKWTRSQFLFDFGFSHFNVEQGDISLTMINGEAGTSVLLAQRNKKTLPYVSALVGWLGISGDVDESRFYFGSQLGVRTFFKQYANFRVQVAVRRLVGDSKDLTTIEIGGGLGFLI